MIVCGCHPRTLVSLYSSAVWQPKQAKTRGASANCLALTPRLDGTDARLLAGELEALLHWGVKLCAITIERRFGRGIGDQEGIAVVNDRFDSGMLGAV